MNISGLPIHCFDADKVKGAIILRDAIDGETFTDLQGAEHVLKSTDIVVADEEKILALAGIIGGQSSAISETTKNILIELANFDPVIVRKTGTRLGLRTDAELRFEKNIAPAFSMYAVLLLLEELKFYATDLGEYEIGGIASYIKSGLNPLIRKTIPCPWKELENLIFGEEQNEFQSKASHLLKNLGFIVQNDSVQVPLWRGPDDLNIKEDIAEEIARILGYETIASQPLLSEVKAQPFSESVAILREIEEIMINQFKFDQVETYPWIGEQQIKTI